LATTSCDVHPAGLSTNNIPFIHAQVKTKTDQQSTSYSFKLLSTITLERIKVPREQKQDGLYPA
jgi:hypothetical protein